VLGDPVLFELASTPLMLRVLAVAYAEQPPERLVGAGSPAELRARIYEAYVERMIHYGGRETAAVVERTLDRLGWLARKMRASGRTVFQSEQIQPGWIDRGRRIYAVLVGLMIFLPLGLIPTVAAVHSGDGLTDWEELGSIAVFPVLTFVLPAWLASQPIRMVEVVRWHWRKGAGWLFSSAQRSCWDGRGLAFSNRCSCTAATV
jgi:hypothetical protein